MKIYGILLVLVTLIFILAPIAAVEKAGDEPETSQSESIPGVSTQRDGPAEQGASYPSPDGGAIKVLRSFSETVETLSETDYLIGAVAAEMPVTYHAEALKAQAIACYTYALYNKSLQEADPSDSLKGAHLSDSPSRHQGYLSPAERREKWGDKADAYEDRIRLAVMEVQGKALTYDGAYIMAAFHALCPGKTESAKVVWGKEYPYLQSVVSAGDKLSPDYSDTLVLTKAQFAQLLSSVPGAEFTGDASKWVSGAETSGSGIVTSVKVGGAKVSGTDIRTALGLRSAAFTIDYADGSFTVKTTGYGHFVGMSQYGADYMARQGFTWEDIVRHYYMGIMITNV
ncbi:MAG: stage II sporulation protein D [Oscillospiraceae bacterium]|nr:stage II sporulation protein D [Oscillospiraceae bacterium]